ncbi:winged helix-turn-helix domain-containing protein [Nocardia sp. NPDC051981]|uniref:winged helix-turn-helix domain-containing protein n=1 Tax=Nocardia sp. NPDC051981 TaxID=3155417 RepID=UPI0034314635
MAGRGGPRRPGGGDFVSQLRRKIDTGHPPLIHTVRGVGYTLRESPSADSGDHTRSRKPLP